MPKNNYKCPSTYCGICKYGTTSGIKCNGYKCNCNTRSKYKEVHDLLGEGLQVDLSKYFNIGSEQEEKC